MNNNPRTESAISEEEYLKQAAETVAESAKTGPVPVDPDIAAHMGAFNETALDDETAIDSAIDGDEASEEPSNE